MKKKFKFHCLDDDSESATESSETEKTSDDDTPEINVQSQILNSSNVNQKRFLSDDEITLTPPPPLPSSSSTSSSSLQSPKISKKKNENEDSEVSPLHSINLNDESQPPPSLPDDIYFNEEDDPPPPEVEEVESGNNLIEDNDIEAKSDNESELPKKKSEKSSIPKSLKRKNKIMTREKELILNTNRIYDYFDHRIPKLSILKAIHAKCGDFRLAILALAQNPAQFDSISLFESPKTDDSEAIKKYLQL